jgi:myo-inositol 2-dehydrogenase/D-chiro-inositol 1-dehydrogenase
VITSPTSTHAATLRAAVAAKVPTFCEKPVAATLDETLDLVDLVDEAEMPVQVGFQRRFDAGYRRAREAVLNGELGFVHTVRANTHDQSPPPAAYIPTSGGLFRDCSIHDFDVLRFVTGREVATVYAVGANKGAEFFTEGGDIDTGAAVLTLDDGTLVTLSATRYNGGGHDVRMEVMGSEGTIGVGYDDSLAVRSARRGGLSHEARRSGRSWSGSCPPTAGAGRVLRGRGGRVDSPCTVRDALEAFRVAEACELSRASGRPVTMNEIGGADERVRPGLHGTHRCRHLPPRARRRARGRATFQKFLGGSATNVAVAAARYGRRSALVTRTGQDPFGELRAARRCALRRRRPRSSRPARGLPTPVTFCEIFPPDDFPLYFYRYPTAPDLQIRADELDLDAIRARRSSGSPSPACPRSPAARRRWPRWAPAGQTPASPSSTSTTGRCSGPTREEATAGRQGAAARHGRGRQPRRVRGRGRRARPAAPPPRPAGPRRRAGVVKQGPKGVLARRGRARSRCRRSRSTWSTASAPATPSAARCATACSPAGTCERVMRFANAAGALVAGGWPAPTPCRRGREVAAGPPTQCSRGTEKLMTRWWTSPRSGARAAADRRGRGSRAAPPRSGADGRLMMIAADHPARGALGVRADAMAMADRADLLERLATALSRPGVDGVLGTPDILEDLLLLGASTTRSSSAR